MTTLDTESEYRRFAFALLARLSLDYGDYEGELDNDVIALFLHGNRLFPADAHFRSPTKLIPLDVREIFLHLAAAQDARITVLERAANAAYNVLDDMLSEYDADSGPPPDDLLSAHAMLFEAIDKAPEPETEPDYNDLPY